MNIGSYQYNGADLGRLNIGAYQGYPDVVPPIPPTPPPPPPPSERARRFITNQYKIFWKYFILMSTLITKGNQ